MFVFVLLCAVLVLVALAWLLLPLLRANDNSSVDRTALNLGILKDQLAELERDRASNAISEGEYALARVELERRAVEEVPETSSAQTVAPAALARRVALLIALMLPLSAGGLYLLFGERAAFDPEIASAKSSEDLMQMLESGDVTGVIERTEQQLKRDNRNSDLWFILGRAHAMRQQYVEAAAAYERLNALEPDTPQLLVEWADVLAMAKDRTLVGKPEELVARALAIDPNNAKGLAMAGTAAFDRKDYAAAVRYWEQLRERAVGSDIASAIEHSIAQARQLGGLSAAAPARVNSADRASIAGRVSLSAEIAANASPTDTVFVVARAASGARTPLAIKRLQVKDLPMQFVLDDSLAMAPELKLSGFTDVVVTARVSKNGQAMPRAGDLEAEAVTTKIGTKNIGLVIDRVRP